MNKLTINGIKFAPIWRCLCFTSLNLLFTSSCITLLPFTVALDHTQKATDSSTPCLYDPVTQTYKECFHVTTDGGCAHFGALCNKSSITSTDAVPCLYDAQSNTYKECYHVTADGSCAHFGGICIP